ncbi:MAG: metallophosphoesterase [Planctomycetes bacterium]|nr:metallophosphoesterase [Planctomycetota bacterium]MBI3845066.1 metallophosphoesterase [Planctomycetota bacterium]
MEKKAIVSDVHGNLEALDAVLRHANSLGIRDVVCLGDLVGYGPNPAECLDRARPFRVNIMGNHEEAVLKGAFGFNSLAREAIEWTRTQLKPSWHSSRPKKDRWQFIAGFVRSHTEEGVLYVHGSPRDPTTEYLLKSDVEDFFGEPPEKIRANFEMIAGPCFNGHTHMPGIITADYTFLSPREFGSAYKVKPGDKVIANVGSVGQPRDGDNRACYVTFDGTEIVYHRVEYDVERTIAEIKKIHELNERNGLRLRYGM